MKDKILERVAKLLAMSEDTSSPHEAAIAASRASKLMQKYNLDSASIQLQNLSKDNIFEKSASLNYSRVPAWYAMLLVPVAKLHDCHVRYEIVVRGGKKVKLAQFLGMENDSAAAAYVFDYLCSQVQLLATTYRKAYTVSTKQVNDYKNGAAAGMVSVLHEQSREKEAAEKEASGIGKELVVAKRSLIAAKYNISYSRSSRKTRSSSSTDQGYRDGRAVSVRAGITNSNSGRIV